MNIFFINSVGVCSTGVVISELREGDYNCSVVQQGLTDDAWPMISGYIEVFNLVTRTGRRYGMIWDEERIITFIAGNEPLPACGYATLERAGFSILY